MRHILFVLPLFACVTAAQAEVTAATVVSDEQFLKSCKMTISPSNPKADAYCACVASAIAKAATSETELNIGRQSVAGADPSFGFPIYSGDNLQTQIKMSTEVMTATGICGRAATMDTLNPDGTLQ